MEYTRITLRIPTDLHEELIEASNAKSCSMNAEIISRLRVSGALKSELSENISGLGEKTEYVTREEVRELMREVLIENGVIPK
jgi:hypothetical protein